MKENNYQESLIKQYLKISKNPTIKEISIETGIQHTRVFRILNGSEMKLSEYLKFKRLVNQKQGISSLEALSSECVSFLSSNTLQEVESYLKRLINLKNMKNKGQNFYYKQVIS